MDAVEQAKSGHPGMPMGMADVATVLFTQFLRFDPRVPDWPDRDRFVLSAGHGSMLLYALLHLTGYADMTLDELERFRQLGSRTAGHPERGHAAGIETTTGPLGQGIGNSVGMALAERMLAAEFGDQIVDHHTYVIASDGDLMEGVSHEAASLAGHLGLNKLIVFYDDNSISIDGPTELSFSDDPLLRFRGYGWAAERIDGHDCAAVAEAIRRAQDSDRPNLIACRTTIAFGAPTKAGTAAAHGSPLGAAEIAGARQRLGWSEPPFVIPEDIRAEWRAVGARGEPLRRDWEGRLNALAGERRAQFTRRQRRELPPGFDQAIARVCQEFRQGDAKIATRQASGAVLDALTRVVPELVGGSADLTPSTKTHLTFDGAGDFQPDDRAGRNLHYGIREHASAAISNGLALTKLRPYWSTFLTFSDYARGAIRLSALMEIPVLHIFTHDSIGVGEDGPTHQPVEQLASLRAMPGLLVFRPADANEVVETWRTVAALRREPAALVLSRQALPTLDRSALGAASGVARGAYVLAEASGARPGVILLATGSEVQLALEAREELEADGIGTRVVSMPCWELFDRQPLDYRDQVLPGDVRARVAIEQASTLGWDRYVGDGGAVVGMHTFGSSAPLKQLLTKFGFTPERVADTARELLAAGRAGGAGRGGG
jgi:transketolase